MINNGFLYKVIVINIAFFNLFMPTIVFVCTANLCRSSIAQALFKNWLVQHRIPGDWEVLSCGTWVQENSCLPKSIIQELAGLGIDVSGHRSKNITAELVQSADLVLCMTRYHKEALQVEFAPYAMRIKLLSEMSGDVFDVPDVAAVTKDECLSLARIMIRMMEKAALHIVDCGWAGAALRPIPVED